MAFPSLLNAKDFPFRFPSSEHGHFLHYIINGKSCAWIFNLGCDAFPPWKLFLLYWLKIFHALPSSLAPIPVTRLQEGSSAPGSAGVSRWQQQSTVGTQSCKISDRKQTGSQEAGILNIILFFLFISFFFFLFPGTSLVLIFPSDRLRILYQLPMRVFHFISCYISTHGW